MSTLYPSSAASKISEPNVSLSATSLTNALAEDSRKHRGLFVAGALLVAAIGGFVWYGTKGGASSEPPIATEASVASEPAATTQPVAEAAPTTTRQITDAPAALPATPAGRAQFGYDSSRLGPAAITTLDAWADLLKHDKKLMLRVEGHADERGSKKYNQKLGMRRAGAAKAYLVKKKGIQPNRVVMLSYGKSRPLSNGKDEASQARNRRVEMRTVTHISSNKR